MRNGFVVVVSLLLTAGIVVALGTSQQRNRCRTDFSL